MPWGKGWLRYPHRLEPWSVGPGKFEVRFAGKELPSLTGFPYPSIPMLMMIGLPREVPAEYRGRAPLHLLYAFDRAGTYEVWYTERDQQSEWTPIEVRASTVGQRSAWFAGLASAPPTETVEVMSNFLPSLLAMRDEAALRILARYLDSPDPLVQQYAGYALNYFDEALRKRVVPGREPTRGGVA